MVLTMRQERIRRGWTQGFVARQIGVSQQAVRQIECGQIKPSYAALIKLEDLFEMTHRQLFSIWEDEDNKGTKTNNILTLC